MIHVAKPSLFGQPTFHSHPHLVKPDETTPGIPAQDYERRRSELMQGLPNGSLVVSVAAQVKYMSAGIFYKFRQASDFWYLTGFEEPDSAVVLEKNNSPRGYRMILFCTGKDPAKEKWEGAKTRFDDVVTIFGADEGRPIESFTEELKHLVSSSSQVYVDLPPSTSRRHAHGMKSFLKFLASSSSAKADYESVMEGLSATKRKPLAPIVGKMRAIKSKFEQGVLKAAADISSRGHTKIMRLSEPGLSEADLAAHFEYICARGGSQRPAYVPVVASGANALIIHYTQNDHIVRDGELVLVDAGCEYNGYASDITRTFPANGKFTPAQHELYSALLSAQKSLVQLSTASTGFSLNDLHRRSVEVLREELKQIGFDLGWQGGVLERVLYPHYLAHPVGIDLHEGGTVDRREPLKEGMVITIEPGVYVPADPSFPKHFHGMGIRIEDEVLVGQDDPVVLSAAAPKEIVDIEGACQGLLGLESF
ncbi:peptidase M24 [Stereum hirsutum FP-91666 SS1]|uniref:peptidase M24 n=1 Tax=Stereum hirsutum (strain FP-91666) TaxID=721885 RepID=UPI0004449CA4|nr:peptidase M24 [Stereum hirsutum FP-91666 SS1]EIM85484.1 peptidase M24 [Stereum hirsutum FP-91666 SS1]